MAQGNPLLVQIHYQHDTCILKYFNGDIQPLNEYTGMHSETIFQGLYFLSALH
jgi:hypothetical protein